MLHSRKKRLEELIKEEVAKIIDQMKDPRVRMVTVTEVSLSNDLRYATVYVSILERERVDETMHALKRAQKFVRRELGSRIVVKYLPEVQFKYDKTFEQIARVEELLSQIKRDSGESEGTHA
ncbi:30S ribosome-binding factor RbfA [Candidatus Sumerlaeota bacterium]|nr:30S ribosome-binding factor RbfA [Candidatus Sumerlaeota bacterium]